ncbi:hypothetical protein FDZ74_03420 [bacterium]|nr:MAG: hypothetical protein FDZ74_03420 [bacterium]
MKKIAWISLVLFALLLAACSPAAATTAAAGDAALAAGQGYPAPTAAATGESYPAPDDTAQPTLPADYPAPDPAASLPAACRVDGMATYSDAAGRFCFAYPQDFSLEGEGLVGPAQEPDAARARLLILSEALQSGSDLKTVIENRLAEYGQADSTLQIQRVDVQVGGEPAASLEPVPGEPGSIDYLLVHGGEVITLRFQPNVETYPQSRPDRNALVDMVVKSFTFLK